MRRMKRLLILVAILAGLAIPTTAGAAVPCRDRIYNDWYHDGRIASSYPTSCYRDALKHIPTDAKVYSSLSTDIKSAMLASLRRQSGKPAPKEVGHGLGAIGTGGVHGATVSLGTSTKHDPPLASGTNAGGTNPGGTSTLSSGPVSDSGSGIPLPILVLGGLALLLAALGAGGAGVRYARSRR
jgi:hypothetical protein